MTYIIGLNGPPGAGKNAVADELVRLFGRVYGVEPFVMALAAPLRQIASQLTGVDMTDDTAYAKAKATQFPHLNDETGRQVMISITEEYLKPRYGPTIWADATIRKINGLHWRRPLNERVVILTDVGFVHERLAIEEAFPRTAFIGIDRPGCSFVGDSRGWIGYGPGDTNHEYMVNPGTHHRQLTGLAGRVHYFVHNTLQWDLPHAQIPLPDIDNGD